MLNQTNLKSYILELEDNGRSPNTIKTYNFYLGRFIKYIEDLNITGDNCRDIINKYKSYLLRSRELAPSSVKTEVEVIKRFLTYQGYDCEKVESPKLPDKAPKYLNPEDVEKLLQAPGGIYETRDKAILSLLYYSGLRVSELIQLNKEDVNFNDASIQIKRGKGGTARAGFTHKTTIEKIGLMLASRNDENPALFINREGGRLSVRSVQRIVKKASLKAGLQDKKVSPHVLRHSIAVNLLTMDDPLDIKSIQQLLGHRSLNTTMIYTKINDNDLKHRVQGAYDRLNGI